MKSVKEIEDEIWRLVRDQNLPVLVYLDLLNNIHESIEYKVSYLKDQIDNLENDREENE